MPRGYEEDEAARRERDRLRGENVLDDPWMRRDGEAQNFDDEPRYDLTGERTTGGADEVSSSVPQWQQDSAGVPIWGWLSGSDAAVAREDAQNAEERNRAIWQGVHAEAPSVDDLTTRYYLEGNTDAYGDLLGDPSQLEGLDARGSGHQQAALAALHQLYSSGGLSDADRSAAADLRRLSAMERGQQLRGANEAALQQMQARGMGGSGAELAARLSGSQTMSQGQAMADASTNAAMQMAAMQRQFAALQGYGAQANQMQSQEMDRRNALDAFNQANMDWRRGQETRNTAWANRGQESRTTARQQAHDNAERAAAGMTNQYSTDVSRRNAEGARQDASNQAATGAIGTILSEIF